MPIISDEHREQMRDKLLQSTYRLYVQHGSKMSTQMVCDDAHVGKGTLFLYFPTKDRLLEEAYWEAHRHASQLTHHDLDFSLSERELVHQIVRHSLRWGLECPEEVQFSERYDGERYHSISSSRFRQQVTGMFDLPELTPRLLAKLPPSIHEYVMISASTLGFYLSLYVAEHPAIAEDEAFVSFAAEKIWHLFEYSPLG